MIAHLNYARPSALLLIATIGLSSVGTGCNRSSDPEAIGVHTAADIENTLPLSAVSTQLLDAGAGPRERMDVTAPSGAAQQVTLTVHHDMTQQVDDQPPQHFLTPDITIPLTATAGPRRVDLVFGTVTSTDPALTKKLRPISGINAGLVADANGAITDFRLTTNRDTPSDARSAVELGLALAISQTIAFPSEPIGPGAVWMIHRQVAGRIPLEQTTRATLISRDDGVLRIEVGIVQHPKASTVERSKRSASADRGDAINGSGVVVVDRRLPLPVSGAVTVDGVRFYRESDSSMQLRQTTATSVTWQP